jgi:hypothetical protein
MSSNKLDFLCCRHWYSSMLFYPLVANDKVIVAEVGHKELALRLLMPTYLKTSH